MTEEKQENFISPQKNEGENKKNHDVLKLIIIGIAVFTGIVLVFWLGVFVGGTKARFSYRWAESYHTNFAGPRGGFLQNWRVPLPSDFIESHGTFGPIIQIDNGSFVIKGKEDVEKVVVIKDDTIVERFQQIIKPQDLKVGDSVVVIGSPNDAGQIEAKLIRVLPTPPQKASFKRPFSS